MVTQDDDAVHEAVIGSGVAHPVSKWIKLCFAQVDLDWREHLLLDVDFEADFERPLLGVAGLIGTRRRRR